MLKPYFERNNEDNKDPIAHVAATEMSLEVDHDKTDVVVNKSKFQVLEQPTRLKNSDTLANIDSKLIHVSDKQREELKTLVHSYVNLFPDSPNRTTVACHDVDVGDASPIKQHPYRLNPLKLDIVKQELKYMAAPQPNQMDGGRTRK